ncbi:Putative peptidoglycan binding domain-containing protein [Sporobacter termitidis DSM 10068]|uniref:Putative peptidoglycan binding domain-containing protein n=1 Tax=Sporobacter termitidis DSM 10068 TaxID=1123282 RepID=A0A1M5YK77_9FIRM|nr:L,D-transpeptidase family protein [Sporobacter termitidis]SHI12278.1 Putative peptidoglycan binding domain-containing protein [Sporobacter termitidis DSM 10068]
MSEIAGKPKKLHLIAIILLTAALLQSFYVSGGGGAAAARNPFDVERLKSLGYRIADKGCTLLIDLDRLTMVVFMDGRQYKTYPVSGGTPESPSPAGAWKVVEIASWGEGFGGSWVGLNVPWGKYGIHGTVQPWVVGSYHASHGCIRMHDADALAVKKLVSYGTAVYIKHDNAPFRDMKNGMIGSDVQKTQKLLKCLGYYTGGMDGVFGSGMERAVRAFQKSSGLEESGTVGRRMYELLCALNE